MPRKQNGFGSKSFGRSKSFAVTGVNNRTDKAKGPGAAGNYPSDRRYGSTVTRSAIEQFDMDSTWARWRKGMEYYYQAAYLPYDAADAVLYQGTPAETPVTFTGYRFATKNSDSRTHYTIKRSASTQHSVGVITSIEADQYNFPEGYLNREVVVQVQGNANSDASLLRSLGERVTDGNASANIEQVLTSNRRPAVYKGKSSKDGLQIVATMPLSDIMATNFIQENNNDIQALVGQIVYTPEFYNVTAVTSLTEFKDFDTYFEVIENDSRTGEELQILKNTTNLPPTLGDIASLEVIFNTTNTTSTLQGSFFFRKSDYQKYFGNKYLTGDVVASEVGTSSYAIMPWTIQSVMARPATNELEITSTVFKSTLTLYTPYEQNRFIVFPANSFTYQDVDIDEDGNYFHQPLIPGESAWQKINLSIDPFLDQIFLTGRTLSYADLYSCSCPAHIRGKLRQPETFDSDTGRINRQSRYPAPSAKSPSSFDIEGVAQATGIIESWASELYKKGFKVCKHSIAAMFINKIRVEEPNTFPSFESRLKFEEKLAKEIQEVGDEFLEQMKRSEITTIEVVAALAEALNLDDVELGYVFLTSQF
jgi:hypothetical protein